MSVGFRLSVMALALSLAACSRRGVVTSTAQLQPTTRPGNTLPQPPLRTILRGLAARGATAADHAVVFVFSHWLFDEGSRPDQKKLFEGAPFDFEGAKVFLAIGPTDAIRKKAPPPPEKDLVVRTEDKDSRGVTINLAGQRWHVGFTMKHGDEKTQEKLARMLLEWVLEYRAGNHPA
jgi:hypothetical protein